MGDFFASYFVPADCVGLTQVLPGELRNSFRASRFPFVPILLTTLESFTNEDEYEHSRLQCDTHLHPSCRSQQERCAHRHISSYEPIKFRMFEFAKIEPNGVNCPLTKRALSSDPMRRKIQKGFDPSWIWRAFKWKSHPLAALPWLQANPFTRQCKDHLFASISSACGGRALVAFQSSRD